MLRRSETSCARSSVVPSCGHTSRVQKDREATMRRRQGVPRYPQTGGAAAPRPRDVPRLRLAAFWFSPFSSAPLERRRHRRSRRVTSSWPSGSAASSGATPTAPSSRPVDTGQGGFTTGMAFDSAGRLYVTKFSANTVSRFSNSGAVLGLFGSGYEGPKSIAFHSADNAYVGNVGNGGKEGSRTVGWRGA
jgi:hypothetical protein